MRCVVTAGMHSGRARCNGAAERSSERGAGERIRIPGAGRDDRVVAVAEELRVDLSGRRVPVGTRGPSDVIDAGNGGKTVGGDAADGRLAADDDDLLGAEVLDQVAKPGADRPVGNEDDRSVVGRRGRRRRECVGEVHAGGDEHVSTRRCLRGDSVSDDQFRRLVAIRAAESIDGRRREDPLDLVLHRGRHGDRPSDDDDAHRVEAAELVGDDRGQAGRRRRQDRAPLPDGRRPRGERVGEVVAVRQVERPVPERRRGRSSG